MMSLLNELVASVFRLEQILELFWPVIFEDNTVLKALLWMYKYLI